MRILTRLTHQQGFIRRDILQLYTNRIMITMTKMFCMFLCLGCAIAQSSEEDELDMALVDADDTESDGTATPDAGNAAAIADTPPGPDRFGNAHGSDAWLAAAVAEQARTLSPPPKTQHRPPKMQQSQHPAACPVLSKVLTTH